MKCKTCKWEGRDTILMSKTVNGKLEVATYCPECKNEM